VILKRIPLLMSQKCGVKDRILYLRERNLRERSPRERNLWMAVEMTSLKRRKLEYQKRRG
jgi:hypothetical protein